MRRVIYNDSDRRIIKKIIKYLKSNYPDEYVKVCNNVTTIDPNISCGGFGGGCYSEYNRNPGVIDISVTYAKDSIIPWR
ncbi:MAG TPA: hypothetical protein VI775_02040 [Candidatus Paceibacterota bacterium]